MMAGSSDCRHGRGAGPKVLFEVSFVDALPRSTRPRRRSLGPAKCPEISRRDRCSTSAWLRACRRSVRSSSRDSCAAHGGNTPSPRPPALAPPAARGLACHELGPSARLGEPAALGDKLVEGAGLDDAALVEDEDAVGVADGRQQVRDDEGRAPFMTSSSALWSLRSVAASSALVASSRISTGGFFSRARAIDRRWRSPPESERPRSPIEVSSPRPARFDELERLGALERLDHLLVGRLRAADLKVLADRAREQHRLLEHDADVAAERGEADVADIVAVDADLRRIAVEGAVQEAERRSTCRSRSRRRARRSRPAGPRSEASCTAGRLPS